MQEKAINLVRSYLLSHFPNSDIERSPEGREGKKSRAELDYLATMFLIAGVDRVLYVSDVLMEDVSSAEISGLLERYDVANELSEVGYHPLLLTARGPLLMLEWLGPHELTEEEVARYAPNKPGVYLLVEPQEDGSWKPFLVDRHEHLRSQLQLFTRRKEFGRVRCYFCAVAGMGFPSPARVLDRVTKFLAEGCKVDDPTDRGVKALAVNMPPQLVT